MSLEVLAWHSTVACLLTVAGELTHRPSCAISLLSTVCLFSIQFPSIQMLNLVPGDSVEMDQTLGYFVSNISSDKSNEWLLQITLNILFITKVSFK